MLKKVASIMALASAVTFGDRSEAGVLQEDFSRDPLANGWQIFGNTNLFGWDETQAALSITWDSSSSNSYFFHPLGTVLDRQDDFSLEFDLRLQDIGTAAKSGPFQIVAGFINFADATRADYWRGSGVDAVHGPRNVIEFDYFPAGYLPGWGNVAPSVSPTIVSSNNVFASQFAFLELTNGQTVHVALAYAGSNSTLRTSLTCEGISLGPIGDLVLDTNFTDFRADTLAICSYSDTGDSFDSVLAHGTIDNLVARTPEPPVTSVTGTFINRTWSVQFLSQTNWVYGLERATDPQAWAAVDQAAPGNGAILVLEDRNPPTNGAWYRVWAQRP